MKNYKLGLLAGLFVFFVSIGASEKSSNVVSFEDYIRDHYPKASDERIELLRERFGTVPIPQDFSAPNLKRLMSKAKNKNTRFSILVEFDVNKDGSVKDAIIVSSPDEIFNELVLSWARNQVFMRPDVMDLELFTGLIRVPLTYNLGAK